MPNMHVSVFIRLKDSIEANGLAHTETNSFSVTVKVACGSDRGEIAIFADSLSQLADFGRVIVEQCDMLAGGPATASAPDPFLPSEASAADLTHDFRPGVYAINDAVQHEEAMAASEQDDHPF